MNYNIDMGDLLYRSKNLVAHCGVYMGNGRVLHHSPAKGTEIVSYEHFAAGIDVSVVKTYVQNKHVLEKRLYETLNAKGGYNAVSNNCEHIATYMVFGRRNSSQVQGAIIGLLFGYLLGSNQNTSNKLLMTLFGGVLGCSISNIFRGYDNETLCLRS